MDDTPIHLTREELKYLLNAAYIRSFLHYSVLLTTYFLALRASEVASLKKESFQPEKRSLIIGVLKRRKKVKDENGNIIKIPVLIKEKLPKKIYLLLRKTIKLYPESPWLFPLRKNTMEKPTRFDVLSAYHRAAKDIGLDKARIRHVHVLRHSRIMHHLQKIGSKMSYLEAENLLQRLARHANPMTIRNYIRATEEQQKIGNRASEELLEGLI